MHCSIAVPTPRPRCSGCDGDRYGSRVAGDVDPYLAHRLPPDPRRSRDGSAQGRRAPSANQRSCSSAVTARPLTLNATASGSLRSAISIAESSSRAGRSLTLGCSTPLGRQRTRSSHSSTWSATTSWETCRPDHLVQCIDGDAEPRALDGEVIPSELAARPARHERRRCSGGRAGTGLPPRRSPASRSSRARFLGLADRADHRLELTRARARRDGPGLPGPGSA